MVAYPCGQKFVELLAGLIRNIRPVLREFAHIVIGALAEHFNDVARIDIASGVYREFLSPPNGCPNVKVVVLVQQLNKTLAIEQLFIG